MSSRIAEQSVAPSPRPLARGRVIVADDEESMRHFVKRALIRRGFDVVAVGDGESAIEEFERRRADVAVVDLKMPGIDGIELLSALRQKDPEIVVVLMTAFGTVTSAVEAMKRGAQDYITKPFESDELVLLIERALEHRATVRENRDLRQMIEHRTSYAGLVGQSPVMRAVFQAIELVQGSDATVLVSGESGTGKELVARAIHMGSMRRGSPFVGIHCAALKDSLVDSELFGYVPGAFTGATKEKQGLVARASGGTLFLDEVSELSLAAQSKLERFLQEREFLPLGASLPVEVDVRVIAATNRDLEVAVKEGTFRRELLYRLDVIPIRLPALRERREDIPALTIHFLERFSKAGTSRIKAFTVDALVTLTTYDWPGNVRELENTIERIVVMNSGKERLDVEDLPEEVRSGSRRQSSECLIGRAGSYADAIARAEREYFSRLFQTTGGNVSEAARLAGLSRGHLHRKLSRLGLDPAEYR